MRFRALETAALAAGYEVTRDLPLAAHTSFHIGGTAALAISVHDETALPTLLSICRESGIAWMPLGRGSNLLVSDRGFDGAVFFAPVGSPTVCGTDITCPAGVPLKELCRTARDAGLSGLEFAYGIPGAVGGGLFMNAGAYDGQLSDVVTAAVAADADGVHALTATEMELGYRHSVFMKTRDALILSVTVHLTPDNPAAIGARMEEFMRRRREKQPLEFPSAGSYFKRPAGHFAGALIEQCGCKGLRVGGAEVSEKHAGFVINRGGATCADVLALENEVRRRVQETFGVTLEREVQFIGEE
ncbi:MAG: UDP-N-acetylmuramate dehydrogenase [Ruminococcaceae bacterium]|nr:UDP-N-acetylmuramate dehydrogenase [Oscillospiraceae bacterium]